MQSTRLSPWPCEKKESQCYEADEGVGEAINRNYTNHCSNYFPSLCGQSCLFSSICKGKQNIFLIFHFLEVITVKDKLPHDRQTQQVWMVGQRVRITKLMESCLREVPKQRLTSLGRIASVGLRFPRTKALRRVVYSVELDNELLGSHKWSIQPGYDTMQLEVIEE